MLAIKGWRLPRLLCGEEAAAKQTWARLTLNWSIAGRVTKSVYVLDYLIVSFDSGKWALTVIVNTQVCWENKPLSMSPRWVSSPSCWPGTSGFSQVCLTSVCSWCRWSGRRWRLTWGSRCTDRGPGSQTLTSGSPPWLHRPALTSLERKWRMGS